MKKYTATLINDKGYWYVKTKWGIIDLGDDIPEWLQTYEDLDKNDTDAKMVLRKEEEKLVCYCDTCNRVIRDIEEDTIYHNTKWFCNKLCKDKFQTTNPIY